MPVVFAELKAKSLKLKAIRSAKRGSITIIFFTKIFRMTSFAYREAMTTAELPEPLNFQHAKFIITKQVLQKIDGPAARHSCPIVSISGS